jgi:quercetin dioxygenase-like cupin family protein
MIRDRPNERRGDEMTGTPPPPLTVVHPGEGRAGDLGAIGVVFKLWGEDTGGAVSVVEHPFPVGALVPPHLHTREDEYSIVTEGEIGFRSGDREAVLSPGGYITKPRNELHAMWNAGRTPARMIEIISPADSSTSSANSPTSPSQAHPRSPTSQRWPTAMGCSLANPTGYQNSSPGTG